MWMEFPEVFKCVLSFAIDYPPPPTPSSLVVILVVLGCVLSLPLSLSLFSLQGYKSSQNPTGFFLPMGVLGNSMEHTALCLRMLT